MARPVRGDGSAADRRCRVVALVATTELADAVAPFVGAVSWPAWIWGALVGLGLIAAGIGAAAISLGPVLLWFDRD
ncbi:hypothetical protein MSTE_03783 [Mycobacteroides stephanolepidis]|uniref:Uncharacterized protein n=1 Tax=[Mycobacterium] stephanolepidis TaxID=1520670 RepID=A0A1Z4F1K5_9MYCO|nr:hypothetical protein MSTE_03783 [[Mycobacterium] stephanolepidis]